MEKSSYEEQVLIPQQNKYYIFLLSYKRSLVLPPFVAKPVKQQQVRLNIIKDIKYKDQLQYFLPQSNNNTKMQGSNTPNPAPSGLNYYLTRLSETFSMSFDSPGTTQMQTHIHMHSTTRSTSSYATTTISRPISRLGSAKRKDQLKPTVKLSINCNPKGNMIGKSQYQSQSVQFKNLQNKSKKSRDDSNNQDQKKEVMRSLDYNTIKPTFGIAKYFMLCGMEKGDGLKGCQCFDQPCQWSIQWTKNYAPKNNKLYRSLCQQKCDSKTMQQIQKDLPRTYPDCPTYSMNFQFRSKLRSVLRIYSIYDIQTGYVQGMNMTAAVLLYHIKKQEETFWALVDLMDQRELRMIYQAGFVILRQHCDNIIKLIQKKIFDLFTIMNQLDVNPQVFLYGWLLSLMSNCVPLEFMHLVIDKFRLEGWAFMYKLIITYLLFLKNPLMSSNDSSEFLTLINNTNSKDIGIHWQEILENCHKLQI